MEEQWLTTSQAAQELGVIPGRVRQMIADEGLVATKAGRDWLIRRADLERFKRERVERRGKMGRPFKQP